MLHQNVEDYRRSGKVRSDAQSPRTYVYNATLYELVLKSSKFLKTALLDGCEYRSVIESCFETRNTRTAEISKFSITYGTEDPNKEIPISIVYQPRWWFQAELRLEGELLATAEAVKD